MQHRYLIIEGNIGSGKTTLAKYIAQEFNYSLVLEEFAQNTFLPLFYNNPEAFAFPLEMSFMAARYKQLKEFFSKQTLPFPVVADYMFEKCLLFAKTNLRKEEYKLYEQFFSLLKPQIPSPQLIVYLHKDVSQLQNNIRKRGRSYEQQIKDEYLEKISNAYMAYIKKNKRTKFLLIETNELDFVADSKHFNHIVEKILSFK